MEYEKIKLADNYFDNNNYLKAFEAYKEITLNESFTDHLRSDANYMLGLLSSPFFLSSQEGVSEIKYYEKALVLNPLNKSALISVIELFNPEKNDLKLGQHQDQNIFILAYETALNIMDKFTERQINIIKNKHPCYLPIKNSC